MADILTSIDRNIGAWWSQGCGFVDRQPDPLGHVESSGTSWSYWPWWLGEYENEASAGIDVARNAIAKQPGYQAMLSKVPDSWSSQRVALYIIEAVKGDNALLGEFAGYLAREVPRGSRRTCRRT